MGKRATSPISTSLKSALNTATLQRHCDFLLLYAATLTGVGATCARVYKNFYRLSDAFGLKAEITILPNHVSVSAWCDNAEQKAHAMMTVPKMAVNFNVNSHLSNLSWRVAEKRLNLQQAERDFYAIMNRNTTVALPVLLLLVTLANMCFCFIFGGDVPAALIVGCATAVGFRLKLLLARYKVDVRIIMVVCSFVSSVIGCLGFLIPVTGQAAIALGTSVLYLIPGICYLNSVCDLMDGHALLSFSRFTEGMILTVCIGVGLSLGYLLMNIRFFPS